MRIIGPAVKDLTQVYESVLEVARNEHLRLLRQTTYFNTFNEQMRSKMKEKSAKLKGRVSEMRGRYNDRKDARIREREREREERRRRVEEADRRGSECGEREGCDREGGESPSSKMKEGDNMRERDEEVDGDDTRRRRQENIKKSDDDDDVDAMRVAEDDLKPRQREKYFEGKGVEHIHEVEDAVINTLKSWRLRVRRNNFFTGKFFLTAMTGSVEDATSHTERKRSEGREEIRVRRRSTRKQDGEEACEHLNAHSPIQLEEDWDANGSMCRNSRSYIA